VWFVTGQTAVAAATDQTAPPAVAAPVAAPQTPQTPRPPVPTPEPTALPAQTPPVARGRGTPAPAQVAPTPQGNRGVRGEGTSGVNIKLDLTITDNYAGTPAKKTVTMLIASGYNGMIRTSNRLPNGAGVSLNVDATAVLLASQVPGGGRIRVQLTFEYTPALEQEPADTRRSLPAQLHESLTVLLEDAKALLVSQSADPATDRRVTVELMATVLK
jgi:hypothetical protein